MNMLKLKSFFILLHNIELYYFFVVDGAVSAVWLMLGKKKYYVIEVAIDTFSVPVC